MCKKDVWTLPDQVGSCLKNFFLAPKAFKVGFSKFFLIVPKIDMIHLHISNPHTTRMTVNAAALAVLNATLPFSAKIESGEMSVPPNLDGTQWQLEFRWHNAG